VKDLEIKIGEGGSKPRPLCPHCSGELTHLNDHRGKVQVLLELHVFSCPHCRKVLEVRSIAK
jgi:uncharacterized protein YbaR (Trm112 family)